MSEPKFDDDDYLSAWLRQRSKQSELSIEDCNHLGVEGVSGGLPTPLYGHPCLEKVLHLSRLCDPPSWETLNVPHFSLPGGDFLVGGGRLLSMSGI